MSDSPAGSCPHLVWKSGPFWAAKKVPYEEYGSRWVRLDYCEGCGVVRLPAGIRADAEADAEPED